jgi:predicted GH43/DUF377 family glycosyl hydrolase
MPSTFKPWDASRKKDVVRRHEANPILTAADFPGDITWVFNSGVIEHDGRTVMVCRVEDAALNPYMWVADSDDGVRFTPRPAPVEVPHDDAEYAEYSARTYFDPRVTRLDETFYVCVASHSRHTCRLGLFRTDDFDRFEWLGCISEPDNRNGVLFPEKIGGAYARLDRPNVSRLGEGDLWISFSPDLVHWGRSRCLLSRGDFRWAWHKIGAGAVPVRTDEGWLVIFHGVRTQCAYHYVYQAGVCLLDLEDPTKVVAKGERAILIPQMDYELTGQTPSVVFPTAAIPRPDGTLRIYYGAADSVQCLAEADVSELISVCRNE